MAGRNVKARRLRYEALEDRRMMAAAEHLVHLAYVIPSNRTPQPNAVGVLRTNIAHAQRWYADQMSRNGFGEKTFHVETEPNGYTPKVHVVYASNTDDYYRADAWGRVSEAISQAGLPIWQPGHVFVGFYEGHVMSADGSVAGGVALGGSFGSGSDGGFAVLGGNALAMMGASSNLTNDRTYDGQVLSTLGPYPMKQDVSYAWFEGTTYSSVASSYVGAMVHELTHAFGQPHDFINDNNANGNVMGNGLRGFRGWLHPQRYGTDDMYLAEGTALALNSSRYFNSRASFSEDVAPTLSIGSSTPLQVATGIVSIQFNASDSSGLAGAQLMLNGELVEQMPLSGTSVNKTFKSERYNAGQANTFDVIVYDRQGNRKQATLNGNVASTTKRAPLPFIKLQSHTTIAVGTSVVLDASQSSDPDGGTLLIEWDLNGDGTFDTAASSTKTHTVNFAAGARLVRARITDATGLKSISEPIPVRVIVPPSLVLSGSTTYTENQAPIIVAGPAQLTDSDSPNFAGGFVTARITANVQATDRLSIRNQGTGAGKIGVVGNRVTYGGVRIGTYRGGVGSATLTIDLNDKATVAAVQALLRNITFRATADEPSTATRSIRFVVNDGDGGTSATRVRRVNIALVNDGQVSGAFLISDPVAVTEASSATNSEPVEGSETQLLTAGQRLAIENDQNRLELSCVSSARRSKNRLDATFYDEALIASVEELLGPSA